ncbi:uncharacterized protein LOC119447536 [Dermacentor silvarum]|uniref:uncharacterized protein LOC119447536 n=1 Tax=Dermacentor silvarum TaxID=543639 RepID=UPI00189C1A01|nr:uncharacterized protein LOC119447536 [Dermacentor silvarum]
MVGFPPSLPSQNVMKLIKHQIIDRDTRDVRGILALDLENAFDKISHRHILDSVTEMDLGSKIHGSVRSFLRGRRATLKVGEVKSDPFELGARGTPQPSFISQLHFNVAMRGLSARLSEVDGVNHALYADDITVRCDGGSEGRVEESLQAALSCTEDFLAGTGLRLSPSKSELLLYRPTRDHPADDPDCKVRRTADKAVWQAVRLKKLQLREEEERSAAQDKPKKVTIEIPSTSQSRIKSRSKSRIEP